MRGQAMVEVNNVPDYAKDLPFWVARYDENTKALWFYGAWEEKAKAEQAVDELFNGLIISNQKEEGETE